MFTFINTFILVFAVAVVIPLLIHLFNKQRKKKIKFSSIRFLQLLEKQRLKRIKLYDYLLILLRTLILLTLILAFARPTLTSNSLFSSGSARTTSVIIFDTGINMSRYDEFGSRFGRAQSILKRLIEKSNPEDEVFIIPSNSPENVFTRQIPFSTLNASLVHGKWSSAFKEATKLFKENPNFNQELHIISDFQFKEDDFDSDISKIEGVRIYLIKIGNDPVTNIGIKSVEIKNQIFEVNKPILIETHLINSSPEQSNPVEVHLFIDKKRMAHQRISVDAQQNIQVDLSFTPKSPGPLSGYVEISDDDLLADNRYYFSLNIPSDLKLLFIDDNPSMFFRAALRSLSEQSDIKIILEKYNSWARQNFLAFDMIILSNFPRQDPAIVQRLNYFLGKGGSLLLIPGLNTIPSEFNQLSTSIGISVFIKNLITTRNENEFYYLKQPNLNHPLFSGLFRTEDPDLSKPKFYKYFKFSLSPKDQTILSYQNNDPFLMQAIHKKGSIFIMSTYIDDSWTDIQYRGIFLPMLSRIISYGASFSSQIQTSAIVEQDQIVNLNYTLQTGEFFLKSPGGEKIRIVPQQRDQVLQFHLNNIQLPGMYYIMAGEDIIHSIPTNAETYAIHQPFMDLDVINNQESVQLFSESDNFEDAIIQARFGSELWKLFIIFALLFLGIELFLIKKMEGKVKSTN